jgi:uncharacterized membrane protein YqjE
MLRNAKWIAQRYNFIIDLQIGIIKLVVSVMVLLDGADRWSFVATTTSGVVIAVIAVSLGCGQFFDDRREMRYQEVRRFKLLC